MLDRLLENGSGQKLTRGSKEFNQRIEVGDLMRSYPFGWKGKDKREGGRDERGDVNDNGRRTEVMEGVMQRAK